MVNEGAVTKFFKGQFHFNFHVKCLLPNFRFKTGRNICDVALMIFKRNHAKKKNQTVIFLWYKLAK